MPVKWHGDEIMARTRAAAMRGVMRGTERVHDAATQRLMNPPKTGKVYRRRGKTHQASAPGESPASDTGRLVQSGTTRYDPVALSGVASWTAAHARPLELGSKYDLGKGGGDGPDPRQMELGTQSLAPRPFARPALEESAEGIQADIADEIARALK